jgi:glutathione S-transferase
MKLYLAKGTISIAVAIALEEAGLAYTPFVVDFAAGAQAQPGYLAINPKGRVPSLVLDHGRLTEAGAILEYIGSLAPALVPENAFQAAKMREAMYYIASTFHVNHAHKLRGHRWANEEASFVDMRAKVPETMRAACAYPEVEVMQGPFVLGEQISLADAYLFVATTWLAGDNVDVSGFPKLYAFMATMEARSSVRKMRDMGWL